MAQIKANNLRRLRRLCRLSQSDVVALMSSYLRRNLDHTTISAHENCRRNITTDEAEAYARLYKVPAHALFQAVTSDDDLKRILAESGWDWDENMAAALHSGLDK